MKRIPAALCASAIAATPVQAADYTRATDADAAGDWTDASKWTPNTSFPGTIGDSATFNSGATRRSVVLDAAVTVGLLGVGYDSGASGAKTGNIGLTGGNPLTIGSVATPGTIFVGGGTGATSTSVNGTLALGSGAVLNLLGAGSSFYLGGQSIQSTQSQNTTGALVMEAASSLTLGSGAARSQWFIGRQWSDGSTRVASGTFSGTGGALTANLTTLVVGENLRGSTSAAHMGVGTLDLSGLAQASIDTHALAVGKSNQSSASGSVTLGDSQSLTVGSAAAGSVEIGVRTAGSGSGSHTDTVTGVVTLAAGSTAAFGSESFRTAMEIGSNNGIRGSTIIAEGSLTAAAGSTVSARLSSLTIGSQARSEADKTFKAAGIVDLRLADLTTFDVSGNVTVGYHSGSGQGGRGQLRLGRASGAIGGNLTVGDSETGGGTQESSSGLLDLEGTHLDVDGNARFNATGRALVDVSGESAGLRLADDSTFSLTIAGTGASDPDSAYFITFNNPQANGIYYGFAWEGYHLPAVEALVDGFFITWDNQMTGGHIPGVFYDSEADLTYIGVNVIPEPSTATLLLIVACCGAGMVLRRRAARPSSPGALNLN